AGPADGGGGGPGVALELGQRRRGTDAEDAVDAAGVEAESAEPALEHGDVVTPERRRAVVKEPVAETPAGLDQGRPRLAAADAVDAQPARLLEGAHRHFGWPLQGA